MSFVCKTALLAAFAACAGVCAAQRGGAPAAKASATPDQCHELTHRGRTAEAHACYETLAQASQPYLRAEGYWGLKDYNQANTEFRAAVAQNDGNAMYRVRWGMLFHERFNNTDAANLFNEALQRDPKNAEAVQDVSGVDGILSRNSRPICGIQSS